MTPMEFILRFTFSNPDLDTTIVGTVNPAHLRSNVEMLERGPLPPHDSPHFPSAQVLRRFVPIPYQIGEL
jgi:aryl-alcohol dehydrogenase-like predicted oxidoreductase